MSQEFNKKVSLLLKSQKSLINMEIKKKSKQIILIAIALIAISVTFIMLNFSLFFFLLSMFTNTISALILSLVNLSIALLLIFLALKKDNNAQFDAITEIRDFALDEILEDVDGVKMEVTQFKNRATTVFDGTFLGLKTILPLMLTIFNSKK